MENREHSTAAVRGKVDILVAAGQLESIDEDKWKVREVGGIDFNPANLNLQVKQEGKGVNIPSTQSSFKNIDVEGLIPVIIHIVPFTNLSLK